MFEVFVVCGIGLEEIGCIVGRCCMGGIVPLPFSIMLWCLVGCSISTCNVN